MRACGRIWKSSKVAEAAGGREGRSVEPGQQGLFLGFSQSSPPQGLILLAFLYSHTTLYLGSKPSVTTGRDTYAGDWGVV